MSRHSVAIVAPYLPTPNPGNAGASYLNALSDTLDMAEVMFIVPDTAANRAASSLPEAPQHILVPLRAPRRWLVRSLHEWLRRLTPSRPPAGFAEGLAGCPAAMATLTRATIIDAHWPECAAMLPTLKRLAPQARAVATMHDIASQRYGRARAFARSFPRKFRLLSSEMHSRVVERRIARAADSIVVFSEKDVRLLPRKAPARVVHPPVSAPEFDTTALPTEHAPVILFVGPLYRPENLDGLEWFLTEIWPHVRLSRPDARLVVAGVPPRESHTHLTAVPGVELRGFVDDLESEYRGASLVIAPLRLGAGVKFKVLDAIARGVPIVTTSIGAEGIGDGEFMPTASDDPLTFAQAVLTLLDDPVAARAEASRARRWAASRYSRPQFERSVSAVYGAGTVTTDSRRPAQTAIPPSLSVVIPVRNGEAGIGRQLAALARQDEARRIEVIVSDNGSSDRTREVVRAYARAFADLRVVDSSDRRGVSHARNVGILAARSSRILFCDHDDEVREGWIAALSNALNDADVAGGRAISSRISMRHAVLEQEQDDAPALREIFGYLPYVLGGCMGVRREAALAIGGFDETFIQGHEEVDFCWRVQQAGFSIRGVDSAIVDYRQRTRVLDAARQRFHSARTRILLWVRHGQKGDLGPVSFKGSALHALRAIVEFPKLIRPATRFGAARTIGWQYGTVSGHLRYRVIGTAGAPITLSTE